MRALREAVRDAAALLGVGLAAAGIATLDLAIVTTGAAYGFVALALLKVDE